MAKPVRCGRCGRDNDPSFAYCLDCGQSLRPAPAAPPALTCAGCGAQLAPGFRFCGHCGRPVEGPPAPPVVAPPLAAGASPGPPRPATPPQPRVAKVTAKPAPTVAASDRGPRLTAIRQDGQPGAVFSLTHDVTICGRTAGDALLPEDPTISPRHARFTIKDQQVTVEDLGSVSGTFVRLRSACSLQVGDEIRLGRQLLKLEPLPRAPAPSSGGAPWGSPDRGYQLRLSQLLDGGGVGDVFPLKAGENTVGREAGEVTFPFDRYVSGRHACIAIDAGSVTLTDLGSSNGTFVRIAGATRLEPGDQILIGAQLLRLDV